MNHTPIDSLQLNATQSQTIQALGQPIQQQQSGDTLILQYGSVSPSLSHLLYFQNDRLVVKSIFIGSEKTLADYLDQYGQPQQSLVKAAPNQHDSFSQVVHLWPDQGLAVTSAGSEPSSPVFRVDQFQPTTLENYLSTWGKNLAGHAVATVSGTIIPTPTPAPTQKQFPLSTLSIILVFLFILIILFIFSKLHRHPKPVLK